MIERAFFGGAGPNGFTTQLSRIITGKEYYTYILKGGPGTGKSWMMKRIAERFAKSEDVTCFYCSFDPDSLDAVMMHSSKVFIVDGTPPHVYEPQYPGVCQEIVDLGQCWDKTILANNREKIIETSELRKSLSAAAANYNKALGPICDDTFTCAEKFADRHRIQEAGRTFFDSIFENREGGARKGKQTIRQLSVITMNGYVTLPDAAESCRKLYVLDDKLFAASCMFIDFVAARARECGYNTQLSPCLLSKRPISEHLLIDEIGVALMTSGPLAQIEDEKAEHIDCSTYYDIDRMQPYEKQFATNRSMMSAIAHSSREMLEDAKRIHDEVERYYTCAMDFDALDSVCERICEEIDQRKGENGSFF